MRLSGYYHQPWTTMAWEKYLILFRNNPPIGRERVPEQRFTENDLKWEDEQLFNWF
jgi:hypothetical protein